MQNQGEIGRLIAASREWRSTAMALATVTRTWGSAPRACGSHMLVTEDGRFEGSVSGGCVEGEVLAAAAATIRDGTTRRLAFGIADDAAWAAGLPCGGDIEVMVQPVADGAFPLALFDAIAEARAAGRALSIVTDADGSSRIGGAPEGSFANLYLPPRRLIIVGAVQIAQPLASIAAQLDVQVTVIDPRGRFLTEARFPGVHLDDRWPDEAIAALRPDPATAVVALSHDPKLDDPALIAALASPACHVAALGSTRNHAKRLNRLRAAGLDERALARIEAPAGLPIGAQGPAEIAVSIAAGMVRAYRATGADVGTAQAAGPG